MATWTVKSSGGDFTTIGAAVADAGVATDDIIEVQESYAAQTTKLTVSKRLTIRAASANKVTSPTASQATSKARVDLSGSNPSTESVEITADGVTWDGVAIISSNAAAVNTFLGTNTFTLRNTVIVHRSDGGSGVLASGSGTSKCLNVGLIARVQNGYVSAGAGVTLNLYQCSYYTAASPFVGIGSVSSGTVNAYAVVAQGSGTNFGTIGTGEDCVSQDTSAPGSNTRKSITGIFASTTSTSEDLTLNGLNGALLSGVTDRSGTEADLATDIAGTSRPRAASFPIDPGCYMVAAGPSVMAYATIGAVQTTEPMTVAINPPVSNCLMVAVVTVSGDVVSTVDFNTSESLSSVAAAAQNNSGHRTYVYTRDNPTTGSHNVVADAGASFSRGWVAVYCLKFAGDSNVPAVDVGDGVTFNNVATSASKSTTTAQANEGAIDVWSNGSGGSAPVPDSPQAPNNKSTTANFFEAASSTRLAVSAASTSDGWTFNAGAAGALSVIYIKPGAAASGASTITSMLSLMGVG